MNELDLLSEALGRTDPAELAAFLDQACAGNPELRTRLDELLATHARGRSPLAAAESPETVDLSTALVTGVDRPDPGPETLAHADPDATTDVQSRTSTHQTDATGEFRPDGAATIDHSDSDATTPAATGGQSHHAATGEGIGTVIAGRYTLVEVIGEGGMGSVYLASQTEPVKRQVALKLIKTGMDSRGVLARFDAERQALALMDHPNIARIYDGGVTPAGQPFFVMELVRGVPLTEYCDEKRLRVRDRLELFVAVCQAVQHAHQKGIIHRDLKPGNVLVTEVDGRPTPKVIDFGVAKATEQNLTDLSFADTGAIVGTPTYMSPEQADPSSMDIDTRTDVYALGVMLYELLVGSPPLDARDFRRGAILEMLRMVREVDPPRPSTKLSTAEALPNIAANRSTEPARLSKLLQGELDWVVMKALEKDRTRRYDTANGFARDIQRYLADEVVEARPPSRGYRLKKFVKRNKGKVLAASLILLTLIGGIVGTSLGLFHADRARRAEAAQKKIAVDAQKQALRDRDTARSTLYHSLVSESEATRAARPLGYRDRVFELLREANQLETPDRDLPTLRREAAEALGDFVGNRPWMLSGDLVPPRIEYTVFDPLTNWLAIWRNDGKIRFIDPAEQREVASLSVPDPELKNVIFAPDGRRLVTESAGGIVRVFRRRRDKNAWAIERTLAKGSPVPLLTSDGRIITAQTQSLTWLLRDLDSGTTISFDLLDGQHDRGPTQVGVSRFALSADGRLLGVPVTMNRGGSETREVLLFDAVTGALKSRLSWPFSSDYQDVRFSNDGSLLACGATGGFVVYSTAEGQPQIISAVDTAASVEFGLEGRILAVGTIAGGVKIWSTTTRREVAVLTLPQGTRYHSSISPNGRWVYISNTQAAGIWDRAGTGERLELSGHAGGTGRVLFSPNGRMLVSESSDKTVRFWDPESGSLQRVEPSDKTVLTVNQDQNLMAIGSVDGEGRLRMVRTSDQKELPVAGLPSGAGFAFLPDGRRLAAAHDDVVETLELRQFDAKVLSDRPKGRYATLVGASSQDLSLWLDRMRAWSYRPFSVQVHDAGGSPRFSGIARAEVSSDPWLLRRNADSTGFQSSFSFKFWPNSPTVVKNNLRWPYSLCGFPAGEGIEYLSLWDRAVPPRWECLPDHSATELEDKVRASRSAGLRPTSISGFRDKGEVRYASVWVPDDGRKWSVERDLDRASLEQLLARAQTDGSMPLSLSAYDSSEGPRFAVVLQTSETKEDWSYRLGLSEMDYKREDGERQASGFVPRLVAGHRDNGEDRYVGVWARDANADSRDAAPATAPPIGQFYDTIHGSSALLVTKPPVSRIEADLLHHAAFNTRAFNRANPARPNICRFINFSRFT